MVRMTKLLKKCMAVIIGLPVLMVGIILIPVPGPGLLISLLGLMILSSEFETAKPHRDKVMNKLRSIIAAAKAKRDEINEKYK